MSEAVPPLPDRRPVRLGVLLPLVIGHFRRIRIGIGQYAHADGGVEVVQLLRESSERLWPQRVEQARPDVLLGAVFSPAWVEQLQEVGLPVVNVSHNQPDPWRPAVLPDDREIGRMGAEHLLGLGFAEVAFAARPRFGYSQARGVGFRERVEEVSRRCRVFAYESDDLTADRPEVLAWVAALPRPMAVMCEDDGLAVAVVERLLGEGVAVPDDVAVLGVNNDDLETQLCEVPLTSVDPNTEQVGYEAASLAVRVARGEIEPPIEPLLIPPAGVVARRSTDALAVADPLVRDLLRRVRVRACDAGLTGDELFESIPLSRRALETRFKRTMGRTVWAEVRRLRLDRARTLLASTDAPIGNVAIDAGFANHQRLIETFARDLECSPSDYRRRFRFGLV